MAELADGQRLPAWAYLVRATLRDRLATVEWDFQRFLASGKARFGARYPGFQAIDGQDSASEAPEPVHPSFRA